MTIDVSPDVDIPPLAVVSSDGQRENVSFLFISRPRSQSPAADYLGSLAKGSQRTMREALLTLLGLLLPGVEVNEETLHTFPWERLRYAHTSILRARLADRYKHSTANKMLAALRGVIRAAWRLGLMSAEDYHQAASVPTVRGSSVVTGRAMSVGELSALLSACQADPTIKGCRDLSLLSLLYATGLRRQEVVKLDLADYDRQTHALRVRGKGQKERVVYVEATGASVALDAWLVVRGSEPGPLFVRIRRGGHLVRERSQESAHGAQYKEGDRTPGSVEEGMEQPSEGVGRLSRLTDQAVYAIVLARVEEAGIGKLSTHDFRRTFISELLDANVDLSTAQKLAGHTSPTTTARYDRRGEATKKRAAGTLHVPHIAWQPRTRPS